MKVLILVCLLFSMNQFAEAAIDPQEVVDQSLHFGIGAGAAYGLSYILPPFGAALSVIGLAYAREVIQHGKPSGGEGTKKDMLFWTIGSVFGASIY